MQPMQRRSALASSTSPVATLFAFMLGHFSHHLCTAAAVPLLPLIRDAFALDYTRSGLLLSAFSLTYGFVQLPTAAISDRFSKRRIIALGLIGTGVACIGAGLATDYAHILLALLLLGMAGSTYHAPASAFLSETFAKESRGRFLGIHIIGGTAGLTAAPVVAVLVTSATGSWRTAFMVMGLPVIVSGVLVWLMARSQETANVKVSAQEPSVPFAYRGLIRRMGSLVIVALLTQMLIAGMNSFLPLYLVDNFSAPQDQAGLIMAVVYGAGVLGAPLGGAISDRFGRKPVILISVVSVGPLIFLVTTMPLGPVLVAVISLYGLFQVFRLPAMESLIADEVPVQRRATVLGGYNLLAQQTTGITTPVFGWLLDQYGPSQGFAALAAVALVSSALAFLFRRRI
ncbi:MAG TPA: MFS transporter [Chloroflexota bacterium]|nr:MFS transporter [Chloroflexota bacterium]